MICEMKEIVTKVSEEGTHVGFLARLLFEFNETAKERSVCHSE